MHGGRHSRSRRTSFRYRDAAVGPTAMAVGGSRSGPGGCRSAEFIMRPIIWSFLSCDFISYVKLFSHAQWAWIVFGNVLHRPKGIQRLRQNSRHSNGMCVISLLLDLLLDMSCYQCNAMSLSSCAPAKCFEYPRHASLHTHLVGNHCV